MWRSKKGPFKSLADVLEVDGLGVKVLERLCESIIIHNNQKNDKSGQNNNGKLSNNGKNRKQYLTPNLDNGRINVNCLCLVH